MINEKEISEMLPDEIEKIIDLLKAILQNVSTEKSTLSKLVHRDRKLFIFKHLFLLITQTFQKWEITILI